MHHVVAVRTGCRRADPPHGLAAARDTGDTGRRQPLGMPENVGIVDTMISFPNRDMKEVYRFITRQTKDRESQEKFAFPAEYMFKDVPERSLEGAEDPIGVTLREMDLWGIERGMIGVGDPDGAGAEALKKHPDRFIPSSSIDPNDGMKGIKRLVSQYETFGVQGGGRVPGGNVPAGAHQRQEDVPDLRQVRGAGHTTLLLCRSPRAAARRPPASMSSSSTK